MDQILITGPREVTERSALTATARFRASQADTTPTNSYWRLDDEDGCQIADWSSVTPGTSISISVTAEQNKIRHCTRTVEGRILTVMSDRGLSGQFANSYRYAVRNLPWSS